MYFIYCYPHTVLHGSDDIRPHTENSIRHFQEQMNYGRIKGIMVINCWNGWMLPEFKSKLFWEWINTFFTSQNFYSKFLVQMWILGIQFTWYKNIPRPFNWLKSNLKKTQTMVWVGLSLRKIVLRGPMLHLKYPLVTISLMLMCSRPLYINFFHVSMLKKLYTIRRVF